MVLPPADAHRHSDSDVYALADRHVLFIADRFADRHAISYSIVVSYVDTERDGQLHADFNRKLLAYHDTKQVADGYGKPDAERHAQLLSDRNAQWLLQPFRHAQCFGVTVWQRHGTPQRVVQQLCHALADIIALIYAHGYA